MNDTEVTHTDHPQTPICREVMPTPEPPETHLREETPYDAVERDEKTDDLEAPFDASSFKEGSEDTQETFSQERDARTAPKSSFEEHSFKTKAEASSTQDAASLVKEVLSKPHLLETDPSDFMRKAQEVLKDNLDYTMFMGCLRALKGGAGRLNERAILENLAYYRKTKDPAYLTRAEALFSKEGRQYVSDYSTAEFNKNAAVLNKIRQKQAQAYLAHKWHRFEESSRDWIQQPQRREALQLALTLGRGRTDLEKVKSVVDTLEQKAIERYAREQATAENNMLHEQIGSSGPMANGALKSRSPWMTKEEFYALSPAEYTRRYDSIVRQIQLEKEGKLPRRLT